MHQKERYQARGTHELATGWGSMGDLSGHRKRVAESGVLTLWRPQKERHVRTQKGRDQVRGTHPLGTTDRGTRKDTEGTGPSEGEQTGNELWTRGRRASEDTERERPTEGHLPSGDR